jgi:glucose/arabinose dehydrogenase
VIRSTFLSRVLFGVALVVLVVLHQTTPAGQGGQAAPPPVPLDKLKLPSGFKIGIFAEGVRSARGMALGAKGTVFVGSMRAGQVTALIDRNGDGVADEAKVVATGLSNPVGVAFRNGSLYVSSITRILRLDDIENKLDAPPAPVPVGDPLPGNQGHNWRFIAFGPDGLLYIGMGSPCNVCEDELVADPRMASIARMKPDGTGFEVFAHGVRNTVGFDWNPITREMWFTDNGRDELGDDLPNDELNVAPSAGLHFGYPYCHQGDLADPTYGSKHACSEFVPPAQKMGPHVAAIGMRFYTGTMFPPEYRNAIFIAQHGSWNRSTPFGYRVMVAKVSGRKVTSYEPFVEGFLHGVRGTPVDRATVVPNQSYRVNGDAYARPSDVLVMRDGSLLISDDQGGRIFRVTYGK